MIRHVALFLSLLLLIAGCKPASKPAEPPPPVTQPPVTKPPAPEPVTAYDLVIRGGMLLDGTGSQAIRSDVAVNGNHIVKVGNLGRYTAVREIDATGLTVAPGFINPHSHTHDYINPFEDFPAVASLMQGITTEFGGVDGRSPLPIGAELTRIAAEGTGVNFGLFAGQGSVREQVIGSGWGPASAEQLEQMRRVVRQAMEEGAYGLSSGLEYAPGRNADQAEVAALAAVTQPFGGIYSTHLRSEGASILEALAEALAIGKMAGVPVNLSHFKIVREENWHVLDQLMTMVEKAIAQGQTVFADVYPYLAPDYAVNRPLSTWAQAASPENLIITRTGDTSLEGKSLADVARQSNQSVGQALESLLAADPDIAVVALISSEQAMIRLYQAPWSMVSTDGESQPMLQTPEAALAYSFHRRSYGTYPLLLGHYVRERQILQLPNAIRKMSGAVADYLNLKDRGYVKAGYFADLVIFDPDAVADRTTWLRPQEYPTGIRHVLVNGQAAVVDGRATGERFGQVLRRGA